MESSVLKSAAGQKEAEKKKRGVCQFHNISSGKEEGVRGIIKIKIKAIIKLNF